MPSRVGLSCGRTNVFLGIVEWKNSGPVSNLTFPALVNALILDRMIRILPPKISFGCGFLDNDNYIAFSKGQIADFS